MASFLGTHRHTIDSKGRLSIPSKFRKATGEVFVVTRGLDGCLFLYPKDEWGRLEEKLRSLEWTEDDPRYFTREIAAFASEVTVDGHGRVVIPQELRDLVEIEIEVLVIGAFERIELWDPDNYRVYREGYAHSLEQASARLYGKTPSAEVDRKSGTKRKAKPARKTTAKRKAPARGVKAKRTKGKKGR